ncbi:hypothetical protein SESBI_41256 [Sesbania bispinosa]|nr:hypothetical protein SESBI_41256 [Sesbania bispinosa]
MEERESDKVPFWWRPTMVGTKRLGQGIWHKVDARTVCGEALFDYIFRQLRSFIQEGVAMLAMKLIMR